jgi:hypothetical protein
MFTKGRAVHDRRLGRVHLDDDVVDPAAMKGAEHMLDRLDLGMADLDGGRTDEIRHLIDARAQFRTAVQIDAPEGDAMIHWRGFHGQGDGVAGMKRAALNRDFAHESALFHKVGRGSVGNAFQRASFEMAAALTGPPAVPYSFNLLTLNVRHPETDSRLCPQPTTSEKVR